MGADALQAQGIDGSGVGIAIIDTGVADLPDFAGRRTGMLDLSGDGDDVDAYGHGTFIAGIAAGNGASSGGANAGVAPGAHVIPVKIAGRNGASDISHVLAAIQYVVSFKDTYDIGVLNLSLGTDSDQTQLLSPLNHAVERAWDAGIVVVVSGGNHGDEGPGRIPKPADDPLVITVGATDSMGTVDRADDKVAGYSSLGPSIADGFEKPDIVAPGSHLVSLIAPGSKLDTDFPSSHLDAAHAQGSGTSFAAGVASGAAALLRQAHPDWTPDQVKEAMTSSAAPGPVGIRNVDGFGALDVTAASLATPAPDSQGGGRPRHGSRVARGRPRVARGRGLDLRAVQHAGLPARQGVPPHRRHHRPAAVLRRHRVRHDRLDRVAVVRVAVVRVAVVRVAVVRVAVVRVASGTGRSGTAPSGITTAGTEWEWAKSRSSSRRGLGGPVATYVTAIALGGLSLLLAVGLATPTSAAVGPTFVPLAIIAVVSVLVPLRYQHGRGVQGFILDEGVLVALLFSLDGAMPAAVMTAATLLAHLLLRTRFIKLAFNVGQMALAATAGLVVFRLIGTGPEVLAAHSVIAAVVAAAAHNVASSLSLAGLFRRLDGRSVAETLSTVWRLNVVTLVGNISFGLVLAVLAGVDPLATLLASTLLVGLYLGYRGYVGQLDERQRAESLHTFTRSLLEHRGVRRRSRGAVRSGRGHARRDASGPPARSRGLRRRGVRASGPGR